FVNHTGDRSPVEPLWKSCHKIPSQMALSRHTPMWASCGQAVLASKRKGWRTLEARKHGRAGIEYRPGTDLGAGSPIDHRPARSTSFDSDRAPPVFELSQ